MKPYVLFIIFFATSPCVLAVDQTTCSDARDYYVEINVRETRRCCNSSYTKSEAIESANEAIEIANNYTSVEELKEERADALRLADSSAEKGLYENSAHFIYFACLYKARMRELAR